MDPMSEYLARATIDARLASAQERQPGRLIERERRIERRRAWRAAVRRWWRRLAPRRPHVRVRSLAAAVTPPAISPSVELAHVLDEAAHRIAEHGTHSERLLLEAMAEVAADSAPGAAAALVDPEGTEVSRVRAFGLVHTHLTMVLGPCEHEWLLELLDEARGVERPGRVA